MDFQVLMAIRGNIFKRGSCHFFLQSSWPWLHLEAMYESEAFTVFKRSCEVNRMARMCVRASYSSVLCERHFALGSSRLAAPTCPMPFSLAALCVPGWRCLTLRLGLLPSFSLSGSCLSVPLCICLLSPALSFLHPPQCATCPHSRALLTCCAAWPDSRARAPPPLQPERSTTSLIVPAPGTGCVCVSQGRVA